ncbi:glutamate decarboxylase, partial [Streptomyces sp. P01-F02]|nr:glutamate decarboxylase [Streptomyces poriferorum]
MALHKGSAHSTEPSDPRRRLALNPFFGEADPTAGMESAPPRHKLPDGPLPP